MQIKWIRVIQQGWSGSDRYRVVCNRCPHCDEVYGFARARTRGFEHYQSHKRADVGV